MRCQKLRIAAMMLLIVLALGQAGLAQYAVHEIKVSVPFDFTINGVPFPAGEYLIFCTPMQIQLRDIDGHVMASLYPHAVAARRTPARPKLVFSTSDGGPACGRSGSVPAAGDTNCQDPSPTI